MPLLKNARIYVGEHRLDTNANAVALAYEAEALDDTVFNDNTRSNAGGLKIITFGASGFYDASDGDTGQEAILFDKVGGNDTPIFVSANNAANGDEGYFARFLYSEFSHGGQVGELHAFDGSAVAQGEPLIRGFILDESTETGNGTSAAVQIGDVGADETLYGMLSVTATSGDGSQTLDVTIESDSADDFTGAETTRITFAQVTTTITFGWQVAAGAIADDWFRANWTVGGTGSPRFDFIVAAGIA